MNTKESKVSVYRSVSYVMYVAYIIEAILLLRFAFRLLGANPGAPITDLLYAVSGFFLAPFQYVFGNTVPVSGSVIEWSTLVAMLFYWLLALGIVKLLAVNRPISRYEAERSLSSE